MTPNLLAFLRAIRVGEGTQDDAGYLRLVGGGNFVSTALHPSENVAEFPPGGPRSFVHGGFYEKRFDSTAAGAFQETRTTWSALRKQHPDLTDFSPENQDRAAIYLIDEKGALPDIEAGNIAAAVNKVKSEWESLPGSGTRPKNEVTLQDFISHYVAYGGTVA